MSTRPRGRSACSRKPSERAFPPGTRGSPTRAGPRTARPTPSTRTRTPTVAAPWRWSTTASSRTPARCAPRLGSAVTCSGPRPTRRCSRTWSKSCSRAPARWSKRWRARCTRSRAPTVSQWCRRGSPTRSWPRGADLRCSWPSVRGRISSPPTPLPSCPIRARWSTWTMVRSRSFGPPTTASSISTRWRRKRQLRAWTGTSPPSSAAGTRTSCSRRSWSSLRVCGTRCAGGCSKRTARRGGLNISDEQLLQVNRIVFTACGTSWHSALIGEYMMEELARIPSEVEYASEFRYRNPIVDERTLVVGISQSGETADTLAALREAKRRGARTLGLVNVVGSTIAREVDGGIYLYAGPEIGVASTKAFTSQIAALALLTLKMGGLRALSILQGREVVRALAKLPALVERVLATAPQVEQIAERLLRAQNVLYLGRGYNFPVALEGALKLKEISYIHAEGYPAAEMKHGPIALIDDLMPVVFIAPQDAVYQKVVSNVEEVKARGGRVIAILTEGDTALDKLADHRIEIPETLDLLTPVLSALPLQLLAYYIAVRRGCNVDQPRNLAKSVTVE